MSQEVSSTNLTEEHLDVLTEMINIGVGRAAALLNEMVQAHVQLKVPTIEVISRAEFIANPPMSGKIDFASVQLPFESDSFSGRCVLAFPPKSASNLVAQLTGESDGDGALGYLRISTLKEVGNIVLNSVMGSIANVLGSKMNYSVPSYHDGDLQDMLKERDGLVAAIIIYAETWFIVTERKIEGDILILVGARSLAALSESLELFLKKQ